MPPHHEVSDVTSRRKDMPNEQCGDLRSPEERRRAYEEELDVLAVSDVTAVLISYPSEVLSADQYMTWF